MASEESSQQIQHASTCPACGKDTYAYERDCHHCGVNRWEYDG